MEKGFNDFGCFINKKKTVTNFGETPVLISFQGLKIDSNTLEFHGNYDSYKSVDIFHTLSFRSKVSPGE